MNKFCVVLGLAAALTARAEEAKLPRVYYIGNSLSDHFFADKRDYNPNGSAIDRICKAAGLPKWPNAGKCIAGAPLWWHWYHINDGLRGVRDPEALAKEQWDIVSFQSHGGGGLHSASTRDETTKGGAFIKAGSPKGDVDMIVNFCGILLKNPANFDTQIYVYSTWVNYGKGRELKPGESLPVEELDFSKRWLARSDPPVAFTQQYFEALQDELNALRAPGKPLEKLRKPVRLLPAGDVYLALDKKLKAGELADFDTRTPQECGVSDAWINIGTDPVKSTGRSIHVNPLGQTILSYIFFSTWLGRDCHGLDTRSLMNEPTKTEFSLSDQQLKIIWDTVWDVVKTHPRAGLATGK
jgi:hypothetical protein